jgi:hypothetical protein
VEKIIFKNTVILLLLLIFVSTGSAWAAIQCTIRPQKKVKCTPYPVLQDGTITLTTDGFFSLKGTYNSCYYNEFLLIKGKQNQSVSPETLSFELLATEFINTPISFQEFPRTIGTIVLNDKTMEGFYFDIWAFIRSSGARWQPPSPRITACKSQ